MLLTDTQLAAIVATGNPVTMRRALDALRDPYFSFRPRADRPDEYDEQTSFTRSDYRFNASAGKYEFGPDGHQFEICLGGNGSGKTRAAAQKTAWHLRETSPPRDRCPFWIIGETYEMACGVCWVEKLSELIPKEMIAGISYKNEGRGWPASVLLRHPDDHNRVGWAIEFKSYAQGRAKMQAASIGGYWFNEEVPMGIVEEVQWRCRDYDSPGWADFTPVEIRSPEWLDNYREPPPGWHFYHLNTLLNDALPDGWAERMLSQLTPDVRETRQYGFFSSFSGMVFKEWRNQTHVIEPFPIPHDWRKVRALDFGYNNPFCCLWVARSRDGRWYVYDEHYQSGQLNAHHAKQIDKREWDYSDPHYGRTWSDHDAQQRAELSANGINCTPANKSLNAGIEHVRSLMMPDDKGKPRLYVFNTCKNLIREIQKYRWPEVTGAEGRQRNPRDEPVDFDNHAIDAMRYALFSEHLALSNAGKPQHRKTVKKDYKHGVLLHRGR